MNTPATTHQTQIHQALLISALSLKKRAPQEWDDFLKYLSASAEVDNMNLLGADPSSILHMQGRAVAMQELVLALLSAEQALQTPKQHTHPTKRAVA